MDRLKGKIALVTGGTSGIGRASAVAFAEEGAKVIVTGRNTDRGCTFEKEAQMNGLDIRFYRCDMSDRDDVIPMHERVNSDPGVIDILMNNAGILKTGALEEITDEDWDTVFQSNLKSVFYACQEFIGDLVERGGVILNNASVNGLHSFIKGQKSYMYAASKSALIQFTRYMAKNYAPRVRVNCLCPGVVKTNIFTNRDFSRFNGCNLLGRIASPDEIARIALFLVSDDSSYMTGSIVVADGGETIK